MKKLRIPNIPFSTRLLDGAVVRFVLVALLVLMCCSMVSCRVEEQLPGELPVADVMPEVDPTPKVEKPEDTEAFGGQLRLIAECVETWAVPANHANERYAYCVTDLDGNGRLELIAANYGGTGHYTYSQFYEVSEDGFALVLCPYTNSFVHDGDSQADIIEHTVDAYHYSTGFTHYIFDDYGKLGGSEYPEVKLALFLKNGQVRTTALAWKHSVFLDCGILDSTSYTDWTGSSIDDAYCQWAVQAYDTVADRYFEGGTKLSVTFGWLEMPPEELLRKDADTLFALLSSSWRGFVATVVQPDPVEPVRHNQYELTDLTLDEDGLGDDSVVLTLYRDEDGLTGQVEVAARLGSGEIQTQDLSKEASKYIAPEMQAAHLTSKARQSVVLKLPSVTSTYGFTQYYSVEVLDGVLTVTDLTDGRETLTDFSIESMPGHSLSCIRISVLGSTKNNPDWITLGCEAGQWREVTETPIADGHPAPELAQYRQIMGRTGEFIDADSGETFTLEEYQLRQSGFSANYTYPAIPEKFAVVDMDHDGAVEVVLQLKVGAVPKYLILRVQDGLIYGYTRGARSLRDLKTDGTFEWSGGAFDCGSASIRFEEYFYTFNGNTYREPCTVDKISYCDSRSDPDGKQLFFVDGEPATADECEAALLAQQVKPGVIWYDFTDFDEAETFFFHAKVLEVHDSYLLVEPLADGTESKSSDRIQVSLKDKTASWPMPVVDDLIKIVYDGRIMESYPAQLGKVYRIEILINKPTL